MIFSKVFDRAKGRHTADIRTICEVQREIYDIVFTELQDRPNVLARIIPLLEEAYVLGIKMNRHMVEHKMRFEGWDKHLDRTEVERIRSLRVELTDELKRANDARRGGIGNG